jgi:hypothetical protein
VVCVLAAAATVTLLKHPEAPVIAAPAAAINLTYGLEYGLLGHWKLDETSGLTAADSSGNSFNGTLENFESSGWTTGKVGGGLDFDGAFTYVAVGATAELNDLTHSTLAAWIMPRSLGKPDTDNSNLGRILNKRNTDMKSPPRVWSDGWSLFLTNRGAGNALGCFSFRQAFTDADGAWTTPADSVALGAWQHVALTYDNTSAANSPVFYLNGLPVATVVETKPSGTACPDAESTLFIGNADKPTRTFDGIIDDVRIYNRILSASEIQKLVSRDASIAQ